MNETPNNADKPRTPVELELSVAAQAVLWAHENTQLSDLQLAAAFRAAATVCQENAAAEFQAENNRLMLQYLRRRG